MRFSLLFLFLFGAYFTAQADSIDVYKVSFRGKAIAQFNEKQIINIAMKADSVYSNDTIVVNVYRDTHCPDCKDYTMIIFGNAGPMMVDSSQHTESFKVPLKPLVEFRRKTGNTQFHGYYTQYMPGNRSRVISFKIVLE